MIGMNFVLCISMHRNKKTSSNNKSCVCLDASLWERHGALQLVRSGHMDGYHKQNSLARISYNVNTLPRAKGAVSPLKSIQRASISTI
eukprot:6727330-Heterocapsa_arctica.AAC.1